MAKINSHKSTIFFNLISIIFFVLMVSVTESRVVGRTATTNPSLVCNKVVGVNSGDTCFSIAQQSQLSSESFSSINPNLNCDALFVGQWLCISGRTT
ncbi:hypothetical protein BT93_I0173 [Corymbia citriodora subsp. variegata]|nr:hypothetical protein BT93_I0113 [Corymbia citriodora subsp. variegata]KAF8011963.1 hypothetical protein BT93_I0173 [Corymbia citriodora subsp. variegata]